MAWPVKVITASVEVRAEIAAQGQGADQCASRLLLSEHHPAMSGRTEDRQRRQTAEDIDAHGVDMVGAFRGTWTVLMTRPVAGASRRFHGKRSSASSPK